VARNSTGATETNDRPFIIEASPESDEQLRLSHGEGRKRIAALARGLLKRGLQRGDAVAIVAANCADYLALYMATMAAGLLGGQVPIRLPRADFGSPHAGKPTTTGFSPAHGAHQLVARVVPWPVHASVLGARHSSCAHE